MMNTLHKKTIPSIASLIRESFINCKEKLTLFVSWYVVSGIGMGIVFVIAIVIAFASGINNLLPFISQGPVNGGAIPSINPFVLFLGMLVFFLGVFLMGTVLQIGLILIAASEKKLRLLEVLTLTFERMKPFIVTSILSVFLIFGGFMVFVVPGLFFACLFMFASYEVVLKKNGGVGALSRSSHIVLMHASFLFWRMFVLISFCLIVSFVFNFLTDIFPYQVVLISFISFLVQLCISFFAISYMVFLYQSISATTPKKEGTWIPWMFLVALVGWTLFFVMGSMVLTTVKMQLEHMSDERLENTKTLRQTQFDHYNMEPQLEEPFQLDPMESTFSVTEITY